MLHSQGSNSASSTSHINQIFGSQTGNRTLTFTCNVSKQDNCSWILDSGATDHLASSLHLYSKYRKINPILVKLPNGHQVQATHVGTICFFDEFYLDDVLYLPCFQFNLLSVSKLVLFYHVN
uniref:Retrovirus-related Pol polyprotein from transposon TNT 1-94-like beta-barrel domain-containing protein n=1 Tax=Cajanus cajan TaxID=3821 RepID=A0A151T015_CAJCA|nr:hypothetical protein KK1_022791 [Cajanus cajan]